MGERIDAGELALRYNDFLELVDLAVKELPLRVHEPLERVHGAPNLYLREIVLQDLHCRPRSSSSRSSAYQNGTDKALRTRTQAQISGYGKIFTKKLGLGLGNCIDRERICEQDMSEAGK